MSLRTASFAITTSAAALRPRAVSKWKKPEPEHRAERVRDAKTGVLPFVCGEKTHEPVDRVCRFGRRVQCRDHERPGL